MKKGWLAVEVGLEEDEEGGHDAGGRGGGFQRFVIPISYLYHPLFRQLLEKAYEVYGYGAAGPIKLPCSADDFLHIRWQVEKESSPHQHHHHHHHHHHTLHRALSFYTC